MLTVKFYARQLHVANLFTGCFTASMRMLIETIKTKRMHNERKIAVQKIDILKQMRPRN